MVLSLRFTHTDYEMNSPEARIVLRDDLMRAGFFTFEENKSFYSLLEESEVDGKEASDFFYSVKIFDSMKTGIIMKADNDNVSETAKTKKA